MKLSRLPFLRLLVLLPLPVLWCVLQHKGYLRFFEERTVDWRYHFRGERTSPVNVVYVDVDSYSIDAMGNLPWNRGWFSEVCDALVNVGGVRAIGIDFVFSEKAISKTVDWPRYLEGNLEFRKFLSTGAPVVVAASYASNVFLDINGKLTRREFPRILDGRKAEEIEPPELPVLTSYTPPHVGLIDTVEGGTRWVPTYAPTMIRTYRHLAVELARFYWGVPSDGVLIGENEIQFVRADGVVAGRLPLRDRQDVEINWHSPWNSPDQNPRASFADVLGYAQMRSSADPQEKAASQEFFSQFNGAVVLIGPVDPLLQDLATTPFDDLPVPKVSVHGNLLKTICGGTYLRHLPTWIEYAIVFAIAALVSSLAIAGGARGLLNKLYALLFLSAYVTAVFVLFRNFDWVLPLAAPLGAALSTSFAAVIWQLVVEEKQKGRIKGMFGTYVSPQLVERMVSSGENPQLGGHEDDITPYFSDIQSFSSFSEKLPAAQLVELMNEYLTACTDIIQEEGGTLDKYIGDAVVAMFGAPLPLPDHAYRACVATQRVHRKLAELREKWRSEGDKWPEIVWQMQSRIGLNSGQAVIGNMGSRTRFNYTMMGDTVNLAARMESGAKAYGVYTMITEDTKLACEKHGADRLVFRYLDRIVVKGRTRPVAIFEIVGLREHVSSETLACLATFEQGVHAYLAQNWDGAIAHFQQSAEREPNRPGITPGVATNPSLVLIGRCTSMKAHPPGPDWNGVYVMTEK